MKVKIKDVADIKHGFAFSGEYISEEDNGIVLVTPGNFSIGGGFQEEKCKFYTGEIPSEYELKADDLIVTMTDLSKGIDTLGYGALVPNTNDRIYLHNQRIGLVEIKSPAVDKGYLARVLQTRDYQRTIAGSSSGSTVHHTSPAKIGSFSFELPDLKIQKRISDVLSAYDELIESNRRQIKLLEEAAQRLYKEWFVDLKFPGHETTPIVDGLPEGWRKAALSEIASVNARTLSQSSLPNDISYIDLSCVSEGRVCSQTHFKREDAPGRARRLAKDGSIAWGMVRPAQRSFALIRRPSQDVVLSTGFAVIDAKGVPFSFLYEELSRNAFTAYLTGLTNGSTYPAVKPEHFSKYRLIVPSRLILEQFDGLALPILDLAFALQCQISDAREARDRLLPKLMSGEIEV